MLISSSKGLLLIAIFNKQTDCICFPFSVGFSAASEHSKHTTALIYICAYPGGGTEVDQNDKFGWILNPESAPVSGWDSLVRGILVFSQKKLSSSLDWQWLCVILSQL